MSNIPPICPRDICTQALDDDGVFTDEDGVTRCSKCGIDVGDYV